MSSLPQASCNRTRRIAAVALVCAIALSASGCGRRGDLEPPPDGSAVQSTKPADPAEGGLQVRKSNPPISPPHTPFLLDPLL